MSIEITIAEGYKELSEKAAQIISSAVTEDPKAVLGLATGGTPVGTYENLVEMYQNGEIDFSQITSFNLDEYVGLEKDHSQSYHSFMYKNLFDHTNFQEKNIHIPDGNAEDLEKECEKYEEAIERAGGIDLQLLGVGENGHIAFNEPGASFDSRTRIVDLSEKTIEANARFFDSKDKVPEKAISMGIGTIREADEIILIASGERKANAVAKAVEGPVKQDTPASILQKHPKCRFILDRPAASKLNL